MYVCTGKEHIRRPFISYLSSLSEIVGTQRVSGRHQLPEDSSSGVSRAQGRTSDYASSSIELELT